MAYANEQHNPSLSHHPEMPFDVETSTYQEPPYAQTVNGGHLPNLTFPQSNTSMPYAAPEMAPSVAQMSVPEPSTIPLSQTSLSPSEVSNLNMTQPYDFISSPARIAIYDSLKTAPRVIQIQGAPTHEYIEHIASLTYKHAKEAGGLIPYTVIREVSENFIHANFSEVIVSILDQGNTIRFADQGPGIQNKELAQEPGFSSATEPMKRYIRGVGSGLPIVRDYLDTSHGHITIEDNINQGAVVTISLVATASHEHDYITQEDQTPSLTENETAILKALLPDKALGITEMNRETTIPVASIHTAFSKMEQAGFVQKVNKKRTLTQEGKLLALSLS